MTLVITTRGGAVKAGPDAYALIRHFESCRLIAYPDPKTGGAP